MAEWPSVGATRLGSRAEIGPKITRNSACADGAFSGRFQRDTSQTQAPNRPRRCAMISRQPVRLSGAGQMNRAEIVDSREVTRDKADSV